MTLVEFLLARIAEDESVAQEACRQSDYTTWEHDGDGEVTSTGALISHPTRLAYADHIAKWDPARALAECEAKRRLIELHRSRPGLAHDVNGPYETPPADQYCVDSDYGAEHSDEYPCDNLRLFSITYAGHPEFQQEWAV